MRLKTRWASHMIRSVQIWDISKPVAVPLLLCHGDVDKGGSTKIKGPL